MLQLHNSVTDPSSNAAFSRQAPEPGIVLAANRRSGENCADAIARGRSALETVSRLAAMGNGPGLDVLIVGAGLEGLAAALRARQLALRALVLESARFPGMIARMLHRVAVDTPPVTLPIVGRVDLGAGDPAALARLWRQVAHKADLRIHYGEPLEKISPLDDEPGYAVTSVDGAYRTRSVLLAVHSGASLG